jgi:hypothetical protein
MYTALDRRNPLRLLTVKDLTISLC